MKTTYFFGWENIKWMIREIGKIYSSEKSYFSKKRIESGVAFIISQWGMIYFFLEHQENLTMGEFLLWASTEFAVSGYMISQIQKEKSKSAELQATANDNIETINESEEKY